MLPSGVNRVLNDLNELCELQWQLFVVDSTEAGKSLIPALVGLGIALALAFGTVVAFTLGTGWYLANQTSLTAGSAFLTVGFVTLIACAVVVVLALRGIKRSLNHYEDSRSELSENLRWLRSTILDPDSPRNQMSLHRSEPRSQAAASPNGRSRP